MSTQRNKQRNYYPNQGQSQRSGGKAKWTPPVAGHVMASAEPHHLAESQTGQGAEVDSFAMHQHDRFLYLLAHLIGKTVHATVKNGAVYEGVFSSAQAEGEFGVVLLSARLIAPNPDPAVIPTLVIMPKDLVTVLAKDVDFVIPVPTAAESATLKTDSGISGAGDRLMERSLRKWEDYDADEDLNGLDDGWLEQGWDQFATNEKLFGVRTNYKEEIYTTKLDRSAPGFRDREQKAIQLANEIQQGTPMNAHVAEERNIQVASDLNEEDRYSAVQRQSSMPVGVRSDAIRVPGFKTQPSKNLLQPGNLLSPGGAGGNIQRATSPAARFLGANDIVSLGRTSRQASPSQHTKSMSGSSNKASAVEGSTLSKSSSLFNPPTVGHSAAPSSGTTPTLTIEHSGNAGKKLPSALLDRVRGELLRGAPLFPMKKKKDVKEIKIPTKDELVQGISELNERIQKVSTVYSKPRETTPVPAQGRPLPKDKIAEIKAKLLGAPAPPTHDKTAALRQVILTTIDKKGDKKPIEQQVAGTFKKFVTTEKDRIAQKKQALLKKEKEAKLQELIAFSKAFKMNPVPPRTVQVSQQSTSASAEKETATEAAPAAAEKPAPAPAPAPIKEESPAAAQVQTPMAAPVAKPAVKPAAKAVNGKPQADAPKPKAEPPVSANASAASAFKFNVKATEFRPTFTPTPPTSHSTPNPFFAGKSLKQTRILLCQRFPLMPADDAIPSSKEEAVTWNGGNESHLMQYRMTPIYPQEMVDMSGHAMPAQFGMPSFMPGMPNASAAGYRMHPQFMAPAAGMPFMNPAFVQQQQQQPSQQQQQPQQQQPQTPQQQQIPLPPFPQMQMMTPTSGVYSSPQMQAARRNSTTSQDASSFHQQLPSANNSPFLSRGTVPPAVPMMNNQSDLHGTPPPQHQNPMPPMYGYPGMHPMAHHPGMIMAFPPTHMFPPGAYPAGMMPMHPQMMAVQGRPGGMMDPQMMQHPQMMGQFVPMGMMPGTMPPMQTQAAATGAPENQH